MAADPLGVGDTYTRARRATAGRDRELPVDAVTRPVILAGGLAAGAVVALGITLGGLGTTSTS